MAIDSVNPIAQPRRAWQYLPGQRRVKLAPDLAYDTPNAGSRRHVDVLDDVRVQRRDGPLRLEARRQEGDVRPVQRLQAHVRQGHRAGADSRTTSIRTSCAGSCIACGWWRRRSSRASATSTASACSISTRTAGSRSPPTSTTQGPALSLDASRNMTYSYDVNAPNGDNYVFYDFARASTIAGLLSVRPTACSYIDRCRRRAAMVVGSARRRRHPLTRSASTSHAAPGARRKPRRAGACGGSSNLES